MRCVLLGGSRPGLLTPPAGTMGELQDTPPVIRPEPNQASGHQAPEHTFFTMAKVKNRLIQLFLSNNYSSQKIYALLSLMFT